MKTERLHKALVLIVVFLITVFVSYAVAREITSGRVSLRDESTEYESEFSTQEEISSMPEVESLSEKITKPIEETTKAEETEPTTKIEYEEEDVEDDGDDDEDYYEEDYESGYAIYSPSYFKEAGVIWWNGWRWTWYSERVLPGYDLNIPGRYTDAQGYVRDGDGYICLATDGLAKGTIIDTPFGHAGKIYDCGCGTETIDVYVGW